MLLVHRDASAHPLQIKFHKTDVVSGCMQNKINLHENLVSQALQKVQGVQGPPPLPCLLALQLVLVHQGPPKNGNRDRRPTLVKQLEGTF